MRITESQLRRIVRKLIREAPLADIYPTQSTKFHTWPAPASGDYSYTQSAYKPAEIIQRIGIDHDQPRIAPQPIEHRTAEGAHPGAIFDKQPAFVPVDRLQHPFDREPRGRDDRADHDRVFDKALQKDPPGPHCALDAVLDAGRNRLVGKLGKSHAGDRILYSTAGTMWFHKFAGPLQGGCDGHRDRGDDPS